MTKALGEGVRFLLIAVVVLGAMSCGGPTIHSGPSTTGGGGGGASADYDEEAIIAMFNEPGSRLRGVARLTLINESTGRRLTLVFMSFSPVRFQAERMVYFLNSYINDGQDIAAVLVFAFEQAPQIRTYYPSPSNNEVMVGFTFGPEFRGGDPETAWSNVGGGRGTLRIERQVGRALLGTMTGRLDMNNGQGYYRIDEGIVLLATM